MDWAGPIGKERLQSEIQLAEAADFCLGRLWFSPSTRQLRQGDRQETIEPRVMQLLVALARQRGEVVSRDALVESCWGGRAIGEDAINRCIGKARGLAQRHGGFSLETIPRVGYRLIEEGATQVLPSGPVPPGGQEAAAGRRASRGAGLRIAAMLIGCLIIVAASVYFLRGSFQPTVRAPTVLVMAFGNLSEGAEVRDLAGGVTMTVSDALTGAGLPVVSRTADPGAGKTALAEARALGASYLVSGAVRREGDALQVFSRVDDVASGIAILSQTLEAKGKEAERLADRSAAGIAGAIAETQAFSAGNTGKGGDAPATTKLLLTLAQWHKGETLAALEMARQLAREAPDWGVAQFTYAWVAARAIPQLAPATRPAIVGEARAAGLRAQALMPRFGDAHVVDCELRPIDATACEDGFRRWLSLDRDAPFTSTYLDGLLMDNGRLHEADALAEGALAADPFNPLKVSRRFHLANLLGHSEDARYFGQYADRYWPPLRFAGPHFIAAVAMNRMAEAEAVLNGEQGSIVEPKGADGPARRIFEALRSRDPADIAAAREACVRDWDTGLVVPVCVNGLSVLGDLDGAFAVANRAYPDIVGATPAQAEARFLAGFDHMLSRFFLFGSAAKAMRADPRFARLAARTGMLGYWRARGPPDFCAVEKAPVCSLLPPPGKR
ncbi:MAG: hypothetical protein JWO25_144 [Alphaproteobacteria bacterium]|nr:hypothetical protein [Alphaproteobacteria bacterium]